MDDSGMSSMVGQTNACFPLSGSQAEFDNSQLVQYSKKVWRVVSSAPVLPLFR
jgi:hypothetical protein